MTTLDEYLEKHPVDPVSYAKTFRLILAQVNAYRLREVREEQAKTQQDVAESLGVSQRRVSEIEGGELERIKLDTLRRYVEALGGSLYVQAVIGDQTYPIIEGRQPTKA